METNRKEVAVLAIAAKQTVEPHGLAHSEQADFARNRTGLYGGLPETRSENAQFPYGRNE